MTDLKPCPLCGSTNVTCFAEYDGDNWENTPVYRAVVACLGCHEERREVAEKLRASIPGDGVMRRGDKGWSLLYRTIFGHYMGHQSAGRTYSEVAGRLADLIEPQAERTCRVESSHEVEGDGCYSYFKYELTCGHEIAWGDQLPPSYCPECGRRVLYDSNDYI